MILRLHSKKEGKKRAQDLLECRLLTPEERTTLEPYRKHLTFLRGSGA
jgi:hypothetical protein